MALKTKNDIAELTPEVPTREITCHKCGYTWVTVARGAMVTCPSCQYKTGGTKNNKQATEPED